MTHENISTHDIDAVLRTGKICCACGKEHETSVKEVVIDRGILRRIPTLVRKHKGSRAFIIADRNTFKAAGETVCKFMKEEGLLFSYFVYPDARPEPNEQSVGAAVMHYDTKCDFIIGIGSGTVNDIGKVLAKMTGCTYMIVGTAPSMDGYASATSSMIRDGIKISLDSVCPAVIVADLDVLCKAPKELLQAGMGDMLAKYISLCEWKIAHIITGEYYCEQIAKMVRESLKRCIAAIGLRNRSPEAVKAVMEGLVLSGMAMGFAGVSRPASGMEHYFSHLWDMRALEFHAPSALHGNQCGVATLLSLRIYEFIRNANPSYEKAKNYVSQFSVDAWNQFLRDFLGKSAGALIELEKREGKYNPLAHQKRLETILSNWNEILDTINRELPEYHQAEQLLMELGSPVAAGELGYTREEVRDTFLATKDIRDKYIGSRLLWDLGLIDEAAEFLCKTTY